MEYQNIVQLASIFSKNYAGDVLRLLIIYQDISASEVASRLNLHIKTAQDFLEELCLLKIVQRKEVFEKKRPYFRYFIIQTEIKFKFDLTSLYNKEKENLKLKEKIREKTNSGALFTTATNNNYISTISTFFGKGRQRSERKIRLTTTQGKFLYHLPFPNAAFLSVSEIIKRAGINTSKSSEILDIVDLLKQINIIEISSENYEAN